MINPFGDVGWVTTLYQKRGGHCFFIFKSDVTLEITKFLIKNGVSDLTLPCSKAGVTYEREKTYESKKSIRDEGFCLCASGTDIPGGIYLLSDRGAVPDQFYGLEHVK